MNMRAFGARLTRAREQRQLTVAALARLMRVDFMQISRYEKGQSLPSFDTMVRLGTVLQVSLDALVSGSEFPEAPPPPFRNTRILARMRELDGLPEDRQELALRVLEAVIAGELDGLASRLRA